MTLKKLGVCFTLGLGLVCLPIDPSFIAQKSQSLAMAAMQPTFSVVKGQIERGKTLAAALSQLVSDREIHDLVETARPNYDLSLIHI